MSEGKKRFFAKRKYQYTVYGLQNIATNKWYIGITRQGFVVRQSHHLYLLSVGKHHSSKLQNSYHKHGGSVWVWHILDMGKMTWEKAKNAERQWVALFSSYTNGYNMTKGGDIELITATKPCEWNGVNYPSIAEAARITGINDSVLSARLRRGYKSESDMVGRGRKEGVPCYWNGENYTSKAAASKVSGYSHGTLTHYISMGFTCDSDVQKYQESIGYEPSKKVIWNDIEYPSVNQAAKANGIDANTMKYRLAQGYDSDNDVNQPRGLPCTWNEIEYSSIDVAAAALGISPIGMRGRLQKGFTCDADLVYPDKACSWNGIEYSTVKEAARAIGVKPSTMSVRLSRGYACDADLGIAKKCIIGGAEYQSARAAAKALGVTLTTIYRLSNQEVAHG